MGPYYAMFPITFADAVIRQHTEVGDTVLDPFAGRGTAVFSAAVQKRNGLGIELSPVGWVYAKAKLNPAKLEETERRLLEIGRKASRFAKGARSLPQFFARCFSPTVRRFLLAARANLDWRRSRVDRTLMALLMVYLHGKNGQSKVLPIVKTKKRLE